MGFDELALRRLRRAALLHDLGKLSISNRILDKPGPLTDEERSRFRAHPLLAEQILERVSSFGELAMVASAHHERLDGSGYPRGLTGRLAQHADARARRRRRVRSAHLRPAVPGRRIGHAEALELMRADVPARLDPDAFAALQAMLRARAVAEAGELTGVPPALRRVE